MNQHLHLRKAHKNDIPGILHLYSQLEIDDGQILDLKDAEKIFTKFSHYPNYHLYVAELDKAIIGSFALLIMDNIGHMGAPSAVVEDVVVEPTMQRKGVGRKMMEHAIMLAREAQCYKLTLSANIKRERAHAFYQSLGFIKHGYSFKIEL